ncbi:MAG: hypothetical protein MK085_02225 [Phycisphaerales bacterium]|nr:hypothetical protein [Phycisphaerales bacterium]
MNRIETATAIACLSMIGSLSLTSAAVIRRGDDGSIARKDADKLRNIHQAMLHFACDDPTGALPTPGRINLWTDPQLGSNPGIGPENQSKNSSGHLYSSLIAQQFITTADVISPAEVAENVHEYTGSTDDGVPTGTGYEYDTYDPANDVFWVGDEPDPAIDVAGQGPWHSTNPRFRVRIHRPYLPDGGMLCSTSYAHLQLCGKRKTLNWRVDAAAHTPLLSNRGPKYGATEGEEYTQSPTLLFYEPHDAWQGNVLFGDGHVVLADTFQPAGVTHACEGGKAVPDNIFNCEFDDSTCSSGLQSERQFGLAGRRHLALPE